MTKLSFSSNYYCLLGIHPVGTELPEASSCSLRTCMSGPGWSEASWVQSQICKGCDCCLVDGKVVCDGFGWRTSGGENMECCRGKVVEIKDTQTGGDEHLLLQ